MPNMGNQVEAIDLAKRKVVWAFEPDPSQPFNCSAAVTDKRVVVGGDEGRIYAIDPSNGKQIWSYATKKGRVESSPVIAGRPSPICSFPSCFCRRAAAPLMRSIRSLSVPCSVGTTSAVDGRGGALEAGICWQLKTSPSAATEKRNE